MNLSGKSCRYAVCPLSIKVTGSEDLLLATHIKEAPHLTTEREELCLPASYLGNLEDQILTG